jgi:hypothetical protein
MLRLPLKVMDSKAMETPRKQFASWLGGIPPPVFFWRTIERTRPDQRTQSIAEISRKSAQKSGMRLKVKADEDQERGQSTDH